MFPVSRVAPPPQRPAYRSRGGGKLTCAALEPPGESLAQPFVSLWRKRRLSAIHSFRGTRFHRRRILFHLFTTHRFLCFLVLPFFCSLCLLSTTSIHHIFTFSKPPQCRSTPSSPDGWGLQVRITRLPGPLLDGFPCLV